MEPFNRDPFDDLLSSWASTIRTTPPENTPGATLTPIRSDPFDDALDVWAQGIRRENVEDPVMKERRLRAEQLRREQQMEAEGLKAPVGSGTRPGVMQQLRADVAELGGRIGGQIPASELERMSNLSLADAGRNILTNPMRGMGDILPAAFNQLPGASEWLKSGADYLRENVADPISEGASVIAAPPQTTGQEIARATPMTAALVGSYAVPGGAAVGSALAYETVFASEYRDMIDRGVDPQIADQVASTSAGAQTIIELLGGPEAAILAKSGGKALADVIYRAAKSAAGEGFEEVGQGMMNYAARAATGEFDGMPWDELMLTMGKDLGKQFKIGVSMGLGLGGAVELAKLPGGMREAREERERMAEWEGMRDESLGIAEDARQELVARKELQDTSEAILRGAEPKIQNDDPFTILDRYAAQEGVQQPEADRRLQMLMEGLGVEEPLPPGVRDLRDQSQAILESAEPRVQNEDAMLQLEREAARAGVEQPSPERRLEMLMEGMQEAPAQTREQRLDAIPESALIEFPDMPANNNGNIALRYFTPEAQEGLRASGFVTTELSQDGEPYEAVNAEYLWQARTRRQAANQQGTGLPPAGGSATIGADAEQAPSEPAPSDLGGVPRGAEKRGSAELPPGSRAGDGVRLRNGGRLPGPVQDAGKGRKKSGEFYLTADGVPIPNLPEAGGLFRGQRVTDELRVGAPYRSGPAAAIPVTTDIGLAREFYERGGGAEGGRELVELAAKVANPFSYEHAYTPQRLSQISEGAVRRAQEAGDVEEDGSISGWNFVGHLRNEYLASIGKEGTTDPAEIGEAFHAVGRRLVAAGFDSTFFMHEKSDGTFAPEWGLIRPGIGPQEHTDLPAARRVRRIEGPAQASDTEVLLAAQEKLDRSEDSIFTPGTARTAPQREITPEEKAASERKRRARSAGKASGVARANKAFMEGNLDALEEQSWDDLQNLLWEREEELDPRDIEREVTAHEEAAKKAGLTPQEYAARRLHPEDFGLTEEEASRLGPEIPSSPATPVAGISEAEAEAVPEPSEEDDRARQRLAQGRAEKLEEGETEEELPESVEIDNVVTELHSKEDEYAELAAEVEDKPTRKNKAALKKLEQEIDALEEKLANLTNPDETTEEATDESEAEAVNRYSWREAMAEEFGEPEPGKEKRWAAQVVGDRRFKIERDPDTGMAYASWVPDPTAPDDAEFLDGIEVPYKASDRPDKIKARMAKKMAEALADESIPARAAKGKFAPTMGATTPKTVSGRLRLALPELVELAEALGNGELPRVMRALRKGVSGLTRGTGIKLSADIFKDTEQAAAVIGHEIGHVADFIPEGTTKRGNILGRIASLFKYLKPTLGKLSNKEIRDELIEVSEAWRPGLKTAKGREKAYRRSSEELYADAFSMLLNDPERLQQMAPKFYEAFEQHLANKPELEKFYNELTERGQKGEEEVLAHREERVDQMLEGGEKQQAEQLEASTKREPLTLRDALGDASKGLVDSNHALYALRNRFKQGTPQRALAQRAIDKIEELALSGSAQTAIVADFFQNVLEPLDKAGATIREAGALMFYRRVTGSRATIANPLGMTAEEGKKHLDRLKKRLGEKKYDEILAALDKYQQTTRKKLLEDLRDSGAVSDEFIEAALKADDYARFEVMKWSKDKSVGEATGLGALRAQYGTLDKIGNPLIATLLVDLGIQRLIDRTNAARAVVEAAKAIGKAEDAKVEWVGKRRQPKAPSSDSGKGLITYMDKGKVKGVVVPKALAELFERNHKEAGAAARLWDGFVMAPLRTMFITHNPGFAVWNIVKDIRRTVRNTPGWHLWGRAKIYWQAMKDVANAQAMDELLPDEIEMLRNKGLVSVGGKVWEAAMGMEPGDRAFAIIAHKVGLSDKAHREQVRQPFYRFAMRLLRTGEEFEKGMRFLTDVSERTVKVGTERYLKKYYPGMSTAERAAMIRNRAGTPNIRRRGSADGITNRIFMFSRVAKEGYRGSWEAFREDPVSYALKMATFDVLPALIAAAAARGLLGDDDKKAFRAMSEHDKANYTPIPLGWLPNGKLVMMRIPHDYEGQLWHSLAWKFATNKMEAKDLARALVENIPWGPASFNPVFDAGGYIINYAAGKNPVDSYRGRYILTDREFEEGGAVAWEKVLKSAWNEVGGTLYKFKTYDESEVKTELEEVLGVPLVGGFLGRAVKVTDAGFSELGRGELAEARSEKARDSRVRDEAIKEALRKNRNVNTRLLRIQLKKKGIDVYERSGDFNRRVEHWKEQLYGSSMDRLRQTARNKRERKILGVPERRPRR